MRLRRSAARRPLRRSISSSANWNETLARLIPGVDRVETMNAVARARRRPPVACRHGQARVGLAPARLRPGDQLRGRHPEQRAGRAVRRPPARRLRDGGRRPDADRLRALRSDRPHRGRTRSGSSSARSTCPAGSLRGRIGRRGTPRGLAVPAEARVAGGRAPGGRRGRPPDRRRPRGRRPRDQAMEPATGSPTWRTVSRRLVSAAIVLSGDAGDRSLVDAVKAELAPTVRCVDLAGGRISSRSRRCSGRQPAGHR